MRFRNQSASNQTYPINENEVRLTRDSFSLRWDNIKDMLNDEGFGYREDGFVQEAIYC